MVDTPPDKLTAISPTADQIAAAKDANASTTPTTPASADVQVLNSIQPVRRRNRSDEPPPLAAGAAQGSSSESTRATAPPVKSSNTTAKPDETAVPQEVRDRFTQLGRSYHFPDGALAFTDKGLKLLTPSENTEVVRALASIAKARGWEEVTVKGTQAFRREAWASVSLLGLQVRGYNATEQVRLVQRIASARSADSERERVGASPEVSPAADAAAKQSMNRESPATSSRVDQQVANGKLLEHGRARYQQKDSEPPSYFVKLQTVTGERTVWGVDLERAFRESLSKPQVGDEVALRTVRRDSVTVKVLDKALTGEEVPRDVTTFRNRWQVETGEFVDRQQRAAETLRDPAVTPSDGARRHPELVNAYLHLRGAELLAQERVKDPEKRGRFLTLVREGVADLMAKGGSLKPVQLREVPTRAPPHDRTDGPIR